MCRMFNLWVGSQLTLWVLSKYLVVTHSPQRWVNLGRGDRYYDLKVCAHESFEVGMGSTV